MPPGMPSCLELNVDIVGGEWVGLRTPTHVCHELLEGKRMRSGRFLFAKTSVACRSRRTDGLFPPLRLCRCGSARWASSVISCRRIRNWHKPRAFC